MAVHLNEDCVDKVLPYVKRAILKREPSFALTDDALREQIKQFALEQHKPTVFWKQGLYCLFVIYTRLQRDRYLVELAIDSNALAD